MNPETNEAVSSKKFTIPYVARIEKAVEAFSFSEKAIFYLFAVVFAISALFMAWKVNTSFMATVPTSGGVLNEGVLGYPRYINSLLPITDPGRDLGALVYSGLMKINTSGELIPDLAKEYSISEDGLTYTFTLKDNLYFHDGKPLTADDVVFTVEKVQDPEIKSPKIANWSGVTVEKVNDKQLKFILKKPYGPFIQNTTLGILPKHLWQNIRADQFSFTNFNIQPVGSGPYKVSSIKRGDADGLPQYYHLVPFSRYVGGEPYVSSIFIHFYTNEQDLIDAYKRGEVESVNSIEPITAEELKKAGATILTAPLPRVFGVFFDQNNAPVLANKEVRKALNTAVDRNALVQKVLYGYGSTIDGPLPKDSLSGESSLREQNFTSEERVAAAKKILTDAGWSLNADNVMSKKGKSGEETLTFSISTANTPDLAKAANLVKEQWALIGADVSVKLFDVGDLNQTVIKPRKYDALLFGEIIGRDLDLFAFWHSSQRNDPGLNIAMYANSKADKLLEEARTTSDPAVRLDKYTQFEDEVYNDTPAVFLYSPDFIYVIPKELKGLELGDITIPAERFGSVQSWYLDTDNVWKFFINK